MSPGGSEKITFAEANAVLMDAIEYVRSERREQTAEVALAIIRILESFTREDSVSWQESRQILEQEGLASYLIRLNPSVWLMAHSGS